MISVALQFNKKGNDTIENTMDFVTYICYSLQIV